MAAGRMTAGRNIQHGAGSMGSNPEDCSVCMMTFDDAVQRPRSLPCGHTFCSMCVNGLMKEDQVTCPHCRTRHTLPREGYFPINYSLESGLKKIRAAAVAYTSPPPCARKSVKASEISFGTVSHLNVDIRTMTEYTKIILQTGCVYAILKTEGQTRHGRISLEDDRLYLHCFQDRPVPFCVATLKVEEVVPAETNCLVFLDIAWPGSFTRRVLIRLQPRTPLGEQFKLLCMGKRGPSYINTRLWVYNKGQPGEWVAGGDYENNDGTGGAALLPNLCKGEYRQSGRAGVVFRVYRGDDKSDWNAMFGIHTRGYNAGGAAITVFGDVVQGLEDLVVAAHHTPIKDVTVVDCGVVL